MILLPTFQRHQWTNQSPSLDKKAVVDLIGGHSLLRCIVDVV